MHREGSSFEAYCSICERTLRFPTPDYYDCRSHLKSEDCAYGGCVPRDRAVGATILSLFERDLLKRLSIHEAAPSSRGITLWLRTNCPGYVQSGYFPDRPFGTTVSGYRNEDLENQTFPDRTFDLVLHLDVLEHLFNPFQAMKEIARTLKIGGTCIFSAPTYAERTKSEQVAFLEPDGNLRIVGKPEYHGNPQQPDKGALVTWRYGYDLPRLIRERSGLDVELRRWHSARDAIMGPMTEVYIARKID